MPNLQPDASLLIPKQQQGGFSGMSLLDLVNLAQHSAQYQTSRALSDYIGANTDPATGQTNWSKVSGGYGSDPNVSMRTPEQMVGISLANQTQLATAQKNLTAAATLFAPLTALGDNVTQKDLARYNPALVKLVGPDQAKQFMDLLHLPDGAPLAQAIMGIKQGLVGATVPSVPAPGIQGGPPRMITPMQAEQEAAQGARRNPPGMVSPEEPVGYKEEQAASGGFTERVSPLINAIASARKLGPNDTGPLSEEFNTIKKAAGVLGVKFTGSDWDKVKNYDQLKKALTQWSSQAAAGGHQTNDFLAQTVAGNPNVSMTNATIQTLAKVAYGQEARRQAMFQEFIKQGLAPSQWPAWRAAHNQDWDQRAFVMPMMSQEARGKMLAGMTAQERAKFEHSWAVAKQYIQDAPEGGWYTPADEPKAK